MNSADTLQAFFKNKREAFLNILDSIVILDIGVIDGVDLKGRAHVTSSTFLNNRPIIYEDAEVIYPGNANGCYMTNCVGMACLIFLPKSCMPNTSDLKLRIGATSYNRDGVKVMPIGNGSKNKVRTLFSEDGVFNLLGQIYSIQCTAGGVTFQRDDGTTALTVDETGQLYVTRQTNEGTLNINIEDTGITKTWLSKNKDVLWTDTLNTDGSRSFVQTNPNDPDNPLSSVTIAADGTISILTAKDINLESQGDTGIELTVNGDVSVNAENINLNGDDKKLVTYAELNEAMQKLWTAMTTTPIAGNGSTQPTWTGITSIDISAAETSTIKTGG
jgi:hypothetical protein